MEGKTLRRTLLIAGLSAIGAVSFGFSYFFFENERNAASTIEEAKFQIDDIKDNYDFGNSTDGEAYTIYFFPSAAYVHFYDDKLSNPSDDSYYYPEEQFGYKEVLFNESGNVLLDAAGNACYKLSDNTGKYVSPNTTGELSYDGGYRKYIGDYFPCNNFEADGGSAYVSGGAYDISFSSISGEKRTWADPDENFTLTSSDSTSAEEKFNSHNQYSLDRFGCWDESFYYGATVTDGNGDQVTTGFKNKDNDKLDSTNTGRYLPIKLTVKNSLSSTMMERAIQTVFTSMGNRNDWHNYQFTEWTYFTSTTSEGTTTYTPPYSPDTNSNQYGENPIGKAFYPMERATYFDMLDDLSKYADENKVIRLFPLFSNSKKIGSTNYNEGGGSAQSLKISYESGDVEYHYPLFTTDAYDGGDTGLYKYKDDSGNEVDSLLESQYIRLFRYNNVSIESSANLSSLDFRSENIWGAPSNWNGETWSIYELSSSYIQNTLIKEYGEGLYNFYWIVANYSYQQGPSNDSSQYSASTMKGQWQNFYDQALAQIADGAYANLKGKHLIQVPYEASHCSKDDHKCSPTILAFEKVDEPKVVTGLPSKPSDKVSDIDSFISSKYELSPNLFRNQSPLFNGTSSSDSYSIDGDDISANNPYVYVGKNIDFMGSDSEYFLLPFGSSYSSDVAFNIPDSSEVLIYDPSIDDDGNYVISPSNVFLGASEFMELATLSDQNGTSYNAIKFKDTGCIGVYDILLMYNKASSAYDVYLFRHSNLFCYVFDKNLNPSSVGGFVDHTLDSSYKATDGSGAQLLFGAQYFIGKTISADDMSTSANAGKSLDQCIRAYLESDATYSDMDTKLDKIRLYDRVSGAPIASYKLVDGEYVLQCKLKVAKNYIFYLGYAI